MEKIKERRLTMTNNKQAAEYTLELKENMEKFSQSFWEEFRNQANRVNKASERRMRKLLRSFDKEVFRVYLNKSLDREST
jgi:L-2-hydroxyglutarate oxidase LhgO